MLLLSSNEPLYTHRLPFLRGLPPSICFGIDWSGIGSPIYPPSIFLYSPSLFHRTQGSMSLEDALSFQLATFFAGSTSQSGVVCFPGMPRRCNMTAAGIFTGCGRAIPRLHAVGGCWITFWGLFMLKPMLCLPAAPGSAEDSAIPYPLINQASSWLALRGSPSNDSQLILASLAGITVHHSSLPLGPISTLYVLGWEKRHISTGQEAASKTCHRSYK